MFGWQQFAATHTRNVTSICDHEIQSFDLSRSTSTLKKILVQFVFDKTNHKTIGHVGHSQSSVIVFGLLADKPEYSNILKPVAPVPFVDNLVSPVKYFKYYTPLAQHINLWFSTSDIAVKYLTPMFVGQRLFAMTYAQIRCF